ncbi:MAG: glycosyltransferase family 10 [Kiritimatiellae bacterium]|nr:glycosyltransferase family 10 [Kiritimatiellia bacterium]
MRAIRAKAVDLPAQYIEVLLSMVREICDIEWVDADPDFVFHSAYGHDILRYEGVRICWLGENVVPDFNISDYAIGFSRLDFGARYRRLPLYRWYPEYEYLSDGDRTVRTVTAANALAGRTRFCTMVVSNSNNRDGFLREVCDALDCYRRVDSGGRWRNNIGGAVGDKQAFLRQGKFTLAFENASTPGYVTEKIMQAFAAHTVPIYWGAPDIDQDFNPAAFVNCHDFASVAELVSFVEHLDRDDDAYTRMLLQPCFRDGVEPACLARAGIVAWLASIFEQPRDAAYRRNRSYWGKRYNRELEIAFFQPWLQALKLSRRRVLSALGRRKEAS